MFARLDWIGLRLELFEILSLDRLDTLYLKMIDTKIMFLSPQCHLCVYTHASCTTLEFEVRKCTDDILGFFLCV